MSSDNVSAAFSFVKEELEKFATGISEQGQKAFKENKYDSARRLAESGVALNEFAKKIELLIEEWVSGIDIETRDEIRLDKSEKIVHGPKTYTSDLEVIVNGKKINGPTAADIFALAIREIGLDKVKGLGIQKSKTPLIGREKSDRYSQRLVGGQYIFTNLSNEDKATTLKEIAGKLNTKIEVTVKKIQK